MLELEHVLVASDNSTLARAVGQLLAGPRVEERLPVSEAVLLELLLLAKDLLLLDGDLLLRPPLVDFDFLRHHRTNREAN